jgi:hypothetical protein
VAESLGGGNGQTADIVHKAQDQEQWLREIADARRAPLDRSDYPDRSISDHPVRKLAYMIRNAVHHAKHFNLEHYEGYQREDLPLDADTGGHFDKHQERSRQNAAEIRPLAEKAIREAMQVADGIHRHIHPDIADRVQIEGDILSVLQRLGGSMYQTRFLRGSETLPGGDRMDVDADCRCLENVADRLDSLVVADPAGPLQVPDETAVAPPGQQLLEHAAVPDEPSRDQAASSSLGSAERHQRKPARNWEQSVNDYLDSHQEALDRMRDAYLMNDNGLGDEVFRRDFTPTVIAMAITGNPGDRGTAAGTRAYKRGVQKVRCRT